MQDHTKQWDEKYCTECGNIINIKAEFCSKCGARQFSSSTIHSNITNDIETLDVSEGWKVKFKNIQRAKPSSFGLIPKFEETDKTLIKNAMKLNILAFIFGPFYYILKGLWKKAISLFLVLFVTGMILEILWNIIFDSNMPIYIYFGINVIWGLNANIDFYRKKVLNENFWW